MAELRAAPTPAELLADPARALDLPSVEAEAMLARVGALEAMLRARVAAGARAPEGEGEYLKASEAAALIRVSLRWLARHRKELYACRSNPSPGVVRYQKAGLLKLMERRRGH